MSTRPISSPTPTSCGNVASTPSAGSPPPEATAPAQAMGASTGAGPVARASLEDGVDAEVALVKGAASKNLDVELFAASARSSDDQVTLQVGVSKIDLHTADRRQSISSEKLTAKVNLSKTNPDGSVGGNASVGATLIGVEGTLTVPGGGTSVTGGLSVGVGAELGVGTRDFDKDGRTEFCARVSFLVATVGTCLENPF